MPLAPNLALKRRVRIAVFHFRKVRAMLAVLMHQDGWVYCYIEGLWPQEEWGRRCSEGFLPQEAWGYREGFLPQEAWGCYCSCSHLVGVHG